MISADTLVIRHPWVFDFVTSWHDMQDFTHNRDEDTPYELWFLQHPHVFTLCLNGKQRNLNDTGEIPFI